MQLSLDILCATTLDHTKHILELLVYDSILLATNKMLFFLTIHFSLTVCTWW